nr:MAG TPA: hypothetical protein [Caudoviricetes sp.]
MEKTEKPKKYKIDTLEGILEIPAEAFDRSLKELKCIHIAYNEIKKQNPKGTVKITDTYWVDDEEKIINFVVRHKQ